MTKLIKILEGALLVLGAVAAVVATAWTTWIMNEMIWALKCAFGG